MIYKVIVALAVAASASAKLFSEQDEVLKTMWESYKSEYNHDFTGSEDVKRFNIFIDNLKNMDARNDAEAKMGGSAVHGITKFSHLSQQEFEDSFLTADVKMKEKLTKGITLKAPDASKGLVDWTGTYTTPVKNQGYCGSCWAFSATEQIESDAMRLSGAEYILSPEQITQCTTAAYGCNGGWTESAYAYVKSTGGMETDSDYPYTSYYGTTGSCHDNSSKYKIGITGYTTVNGESSMASYVQSTGPLSVCLDANNWNSYTGGIMSVCGNSVDHCVQAVGVDTSGSDPYWKVRNSWGTSWGESGFILLAYGQNTCDITNDPTYTDAKVL